MRKIQERDLLLRVAHVISVNEYIDFFVFSFHLVDNIKVLDISDNPVNCMKVLNNSNDSVNNIEVFYISKNAFNHLKILSIPVVVSLLMCFHDFIQFQIRNHRCVGIL